MCAAEGGRGKATTVYWKKRLLGQRAKRAENRSDLGGRPERAPRGSTGEWEARCRAARSPARGDAGTFLARRGAALPACPSRDSPRVPNTRLTNYFTATFIDFL